jgi:hypothetical protein
VVHVGFEGNTNTLWSQLNRMVNADDTDHADTVGPLNGYTLDTVLGFPWSTASLVVTTVLLLTTQC